MRLPAESSHCSGGARDKNVFRFQTFQRFPSRRAHSMCERWSQKFIWPPLSSWSRHNTLGRDTTRRQLSLRPRCSWWNR